jgi:serine/threonine protein kinase
LRHGLFTYHLLQGIGGAADRDGDGRVGLAELFNYVSAAVSRDARLKFGRDQKPWTSATWAEETYISSPTCRTGVHPAADPLERPWREQGAAAVQEIERTLPGADEETLRRALRFLGRVKESAGIPVIFRCLAHASEAVRGEARSALFAFGWDTVVGVVESLARRDPAGTGAVLDGLNAFEAHPQVVGLLDRLVILLSGEVRNRAILLLERKRLALDLEKVVALFGEIRSPYRIERVLGQGLFTASYLARDEGTGLEVVVRVLRPEFANQPQVRARFLDLSNRSVRLVHENLALTREARAFPEQNIYFAVRDYIPGVTLQRVLEAGKQFEPLQVVRILRETAGALTPLHRQNTCHAGIKPSNIFLCEGDRVVLGDPTLPVQGGGLALDRLAYDYRYAPPEMFQDGGVVGPAADFYALGCVAYELACGAPPFVSDNFYQLAARHLNDTVAPPTRRGSRLGPRWDAVVLRLLARSPAARFASLDEVCEALRSLSGAPADTGEFRAPLLGEESLVNYDIAQSVVNLDRTGASLTEEFGAAKSLPPRPEGPPQIPGYEILEKIGRGGMGTVYKARDVLLNRLVALKLIPATPEAAEQELALFRKEGEAVARLAHPNIVQVYGLTRHPGFVCLALEYVEGGTLAGKIRDGQRRGESMPVREAARLIATLARAVEFAHQRGVLHRDLKPSNVLLTPEGQPKIADFGLSTIREDLDPEALATTSGIKGTPGYMAPEQFQRKAGPGTDVYALGVILFELLVGRRPFAPTADVYQQMHATLTEAPARPTAVRADVPPELESVCLKCLEKDSARRYPTAAALAEDLERWLRGEPVTCSAAPASLWQRLLHLFSSRR